MVFAPLMLGMIPDGGVFGVGLWRGPGSFALLLIQQRWLLLGHSLIKALLALAVPVPNQGDCQWHRSHQLYWDVACCPESSWNDGLLNVSPGPQEALAATGELRSISPLGVRVVIQLHKACCRENECRHL